MISAAPPKATTVPGSYTASLAKRSATSAYCATPYFTPGGKAMAYVYSLRIWLTGSKSKKNFITDENGFRLGKLVKCKLEKSRFGTEGRSCEFKIMFGTDKPGILDEESWLEAIKISERVKTGAWYSLTFRDGSEKKFRAADWLQELEDPLFRREVLSVMDEVVVRKFDERTGNAEDYYDDNEDFLDPSETDE